LQEHFPIVYCCFNFYLVLHCSLWFTIASFDNGLITTKQQQAGWICTGLMVFWWKICLLSTTKVLAGGMMMTCLFLNSSTAGGYIDNKLILGWESHQTWSFSLSPRILYILIEIVILAVYISILYYRRFSLFQWSCNDSFVSFLTSTSDAHKYWL